MRVKPVPHWLVWLFYRLTRDQATMSATSRNNYSRESRLRVGRVPEARTGQIHHPDVSQG